MKLSTRGRYATRALLDLAMHQGEGPILLKDIARREQISLRYLEHLVAPLVAEGIIRSTRGRKGGVLLARPAEKIKLSEILRLLEGSAAPTECVDKPEVCSRSAFCATRDVWTDIKNAVEGILEATTIQNLVERQKAKPPAEGRQMYYI